MKNCFRYMLICVVTLLIAIMGNGRFSLFLLALELILPFFLYMQVRYLSGRIRIEMPKLSLISKKEEAYVTIHIHNDAWFPVSYVVLNLIIEDVFDSSTKQQEMPCMIDARSYTSVKVRVQPDYAGKLILYPQQVKVWDYLKLFYQKVKVSEKATPLIVKPDVFGIGMTENRIHGGRAVNGNISVGNVSGDDTSEVFDTRYYQEGDSLHSVHWKLSAKMDDLLVKIYSASADHGVYLMLDMYRESIEGWTHEQFDRMMSIFASLSDDLRQRHIRHTVLWCEPKESKLNQTEIITGWEVYELTGELVSVDIGNKKEAWNHMLHEVERYAGKTDCIRLDTYLHLYWNDACIVSFEGTDIAEELRLLRIN